MRFETITVLPKYIEHYKKFGWQFKEEVMVHSGRRHAIKNVIIRDMDMPNYRKVKELETKYFALKDKLKTYEPVDKMVCLILFLIFILPGVLYLVYKNNQKKRINEHNSKIAKNMYTLAEEARQYL